MGLAEVLFLSLNTGEDTGLSQSYLSFGRDNSHAYMTGGFYRICDKWFLFLYM